MTITELSKRSQALRMQLDSGVLDLQGLRLLLTDMEKMSEGKMATEEERRSKNYEKFAKLFKPKMKP